MSRRLNRIKLDYIHLHSPSLAPIDGGFPSRRTDVVVEAAGSFVFCGILEEIVIGYRRIFTFEQYNFDCILYDTGDQP